PLNRRLWVGSLLTLILMLGGCVSVDDFKAVQREADTLGMQLRMEQQRAQELDGKVRQLNEKVRKLERTAQAALEEAARREREYTSIRDELLRFKIPLEQQRVGSQRSRARGEAVKPGPEVDSSPAGIDLLSPRVPMSDESNGRLKQAMKEFQKLLEAK
ncbi:MAG: hypothetical protein OEY77_11720, partial [Nitrospira sp.]|nr:hypothetical protein [Nitrospira sp.]